MTARTSLTGVARCAGAATRLSPVCVPRSISSSAARAAANSSVGPPPAPTTSNRVQRAASASLTASKVRGGKVTTGIAGLPVHSQPLQELKLIYAETLEALAQLPAGTAYRQAAEAITRHRLEIVERSAKANGGEQSERAVETVERELDLGQIEEIVDVAEGELSLARKFLEWEPCVRILHVIRA